MEKRNHSGFVFIALTVLLSCSLIQRAQASQEWSLVNAGITENLYDIWGGSADDIYFTGTSGIYKLNGSTASRVADAAPGHCIWGYTNPNTEEMTLYAGDTDSVIHQLSNSAWNEFDTETGNGINSIWSDSWGRAIAVGDNGMILYTGPSVPWTAQASGTTYNLNAVWGTSLRDAYIVGDGGIILHSDNATKGTWEVMESPTTKNLSTVWGCNCVHVYAVGENGTFLQYDYESWRKIPSGTVQDLNGIWSPDETNIFIVGNNGTIIRYNGLWSYRFMNSGTSNNLHQIWGLPGDGLELYAVGDGGTIMRFAESTTTTTINGGTTTTTVNGGTTTTTSIRASWCPLLASADSSDQVKCLRGLRDEKLDMAMGAMLVSSYYQNGEEVNSILQEQPRLRQRFRKILRTGMPVIKNLVKHGSSTVTENQVQEICELLHDLQMQASPGLHQALDLILRGLETGWLLDWMGIEIVK